MHTSPSNSELEQQTLLNPKQQEEITSYIQRQIKHLIKSEIKCEKIKQNMQKEYEDHIKKHQFKQLNTNENLLRIRLSEKKVIEEKENRLVDKWAQKEHRISQMLREKRKAFEERKKDNHRKMEQVLRSHQEKDEQEIELRISRIKPTTASTPKRFSTNNIYRTQCSSRTTSYHREKINSRLKEKEKELVTNYLVKIEKSESKQLKREISKEERREKALKNEVKCLTNSRINMQEDFKSKTEKEYHQRFQKHHQTLSQLRQVQYQDIMNRSISRYMYSTKIREKKEELNERDINKIITGYQKKVIKQQLCTQKQPNLEASRGKLLFQKNHNNYTRYQEERQFQQIKKEIFQKIEKVKHMGSNAKLSEKDVRDILTYMNPNSPDYQLFTEFLNNEKNVFARKKIDQEQERIAKLKKAMRHNE